MTTKPNILVVCGKNKRRSRTAEYIFKNDMRFNIRSVGLSPKSERQIKAADIEWSDLIFVMEDKHKSRITDSYRHLELPEFQVLHIADEYEYLNEELIELLQEKMEATLRNRFDMG